MPDVITDATCVVGAANPDLQQSVHTYAGARRLRQAGEKVSAMPRVRGDRIASVVNGQEIHQAVRRPNRERGFVGLPPPGCDGMFQHVDLLGR